MRVLQVPPRYPPFLGGVEAVAEATAVNLRHMGHECAVLCAAVPVGAPAAVDGIEVTRLPVLFSVANTQLCTGLPRALLTAPVDVVHAHLPTPWWADWAIVIGRLRRKRAVLTYHNDIVGTGIEGAIAWCYRHTAERLTLRLAHAVIVLSPSRAGRLAAAHPHVARKIVTIPNGVDESRFSPPTAGRRNDRVLFVSRLDRYHRYKGLDVLLRALATLPGVDLDVVGDGELRPEYVALAADLGIEPRVSFLGDVDHDALLALYRSSGVFVLASNAPLWEGGSSLVALEALSCGMPVVIADGAGDIAREAADHGAGLAVPSSDVDALATAIGKLLAHPSDREAMGAAAREYVMENARWRRVVERYVTEAYTAGPRAPVPARARIPGRRRSPIAGLGRLVVRRAGRLLPSGDARYVDQHGYVRHAVLADHMEVVGRFGLEERLPAGAAAHVRAGDWVIDVGANVGHVTAELCHLAGRGGCVWAIEPVPRNLRRLELLREENDLEQLRIMPGALSDTTGRSTLRLPRNGESGWASFTKSWDMDEEIAVETWRLDDLAELFPERRLGFMKMDVEGFEPQVLDGAARTLRLHRPAVLCEFNEILLRDAGSSGADLLERFGDLGYAVRGRRRRFVDGSGERRRVRQTADVLLVHRSHALAGRLSGRDPHSY